MNTRFLFFALLVLGLIPHPSHAITVVERVGDLTTAVPVSSVTAAELDRSLPDLLDTLRVLSAAPPAPGDIVELKKHAPFDMLANDQAVISLRGSISTAVLDSIEVIRRDDFKVGSALAYTYNNGRINLAFGGLNTADDYVRDDGSASYGTEAIFIHNIPQPLAGASKINLYDPDGFRLCNSLANLGNFMTIPGYAGIPPQTPTQQATWALTNQLRSLSVSSNSVERLKEVVDVFTSISTNLTIPTGTFGIARSIGRTLLNEPSLTDGQKQQKARDLLAYVQGELLPKEQWLLGARYHYANTLHLTVDGYIPASTYYNEPFTRAGYFYGSVRKPQSDFRYTSYYGGYASVENPQTMPNVVLDNHFWRTSAMADGTKQTETYTLDGLAGITMGGFNGKHLYVGGPSLDWSQFICYRYSDEDDDGRVETGSKTQLFTSDKFLYGGSMTWDPVNGDPVMLDRYSMGLYRWPVSNIPMPTTIEPIGSLGTDLKDTWRIGLSLDRKWAYGFSDLSLGVSTYYRHSEAYRESTDTDFEPFRIGYTFEEFKLNAAIAGPLVENSTRIRFTGTPNVEYKAEVKESNAWSQAATTVTDVYGNGYFYIPGTETALKIGGYVRFQTLTGEDRSPEYTVTKDLTAPEFGAVKLRHADDLKFPFSYEENTQVDLQRGTAFDKFETVKSTTTSPFGTGFFSDCLPDPPGPFYVWRLHVLLAVALATTDYYFLPPGVTRTIYPGWNDVIRRGTTFSLDPLTGPLVALMPNTTMNPMTSAMQVSVSTFFQTLLTYRIYQNTVFLTALQLVVLPDIKRMANPPVYKDDNGVPTVKVRCLVLGGEYYPMMQFRLAYPDNCLDAHWHGDKVYHLVIDPIGLPDPNPHTCGYGSYLAVPQEELPVPLIDWIAYKAFLRVQLGAAPAQNYLKEVICAPTPARN